MSDFCGALGSPADMTGVKRAQILEPSSPSTPSVGLNEGRPAVRNPAPGAGWRHDNEVATFQEITPSATQRCLGYIYTILLRLATSAGVAGELRPCIFDG